MFRRMEGRTDGLHPWGPFLLLGARLTTGLSSDHLSSPDDDEVGLGGEVPQRHRDLLLDVLAHHLDVVLELRGDGDDRRALRDGALDEAEDL
jgi:hypothetical protein